jgi:valyl-tRNA synthetase
MAQPTLPSVYNPAEIEAKWYPLWQDAGYFQPGSGSKGYYSIVMPPPNVTGQLHLGHALDNTIQDILSRWRRMQGYDVLWLPGTDHAGIATQAKVEENLQTEGLSRQSLGRATFLDKVWEWKRLYGGKITEQLCLLGSSCDWSRERFTMDAGCSQAVREVFVSLYRKGLIYQGDYIVNWCPKCRTAISDIEVEHEDEGGFLWHLRYPVDGSGETVVVATTRPETMLGDTGLAVHPDDQRYAHLIGKYAVLPLVGRKIPIFSDSYVDSSFGTGAVKVTPAHDPNDYEMGLRHGLEQITVLDETGVMNAAAGPYAGMERYACRQKLLTDLQAAGFLAEITPHSHAVGHCQRCHTVIEPMISKQWFVKMKPLAEPAIAAVLRGDIKFAPERFSKIYLNWMQNIRDWCISRQLWWGHRIPVWYCQACGQVVCSVEDPVTCPRCQSDALRQDEDVLDTWFSSALWPFSTLGWPDKTPDMERFYPTSVLVTGRDIIFFWVARMIFSGLHHTGQVPFHTVNIHGLILDGQGRKMSKSLGNGIDPLDVINQYGADTLRLSLISGVTPGNDIRFHWDKVENTKNFANKVWNASRFVLMNLHDFQSVTLTTHTMNLADRWILARYQARIREVTQHLERYEFGDAAKAVYELIWDEFCDWYIELAKPVLFQNDDPAAKAVTQTVLRHVLTGAVKLLHPFMPFITEEIYQYLSDTSCTVMLASWPEAQASWDDPEAVEAMQTVMELIRTLRNLRAEAKVPPAKKISVVVRAEDPVIRALLLQTEGYVKTMANVSDMALRAELPQPLAQSSAAVLSFAEVHLLLDGLIDVAKETERLRKELAKVETEMLHCREKLSNEAFISKAPPAVIEKEQNKLEEARGKREGIWQRLQAWNQ